MGLNKKIDTLKFQLDTFTAGRRDLVAMASKVKIEWDMEENAEVVVSDNSRAQLNRVLHATRAFDSSLRLFLDKFGGRSATSHSISDYVNDLQRNATSRAGFKQLSGHIAANIKIEVTNERNRYCHAAGAFPSKAQANFVISRILEYHAVVMGLEK